MTPLPPAAPGSHWQPVRDPAGQPTPLWERVREYPPYGYLDTTDPVQRATLAAYQSATWFDVLCARRESKDDSGRLGAYKHADAWDDVRRAAMQEARR